VEDLKKCEGDTFENFKKFNIALFQRTTRDGTWHMESYTDDPDKLTVNVITCANVELWGELGVPELGKFGCDHDLAGYGSSKTTWIMSSEGSAPLPRETTAASSSSTEKERRLTTRI
jgi:hypothetical protein